MGHLRMSRFVGRPSESHCRLSLLSDTHPTPLDHLTHPHPCSEGGPTDERRHSRDARHPATLGGRRKAHLNVPRSPCAPFSFRVFDIDNVHVAAGVYSACRREDEPAQLAGRHCREFSNTRCLFSRSFQTKKDTSDDARRSRLLRARCCPPSRPCALARFAVLGGQRNPCGSRKHCHSARAPAAAH